MFVGYAAVWLFGGYHILIILGSCVCLCVCARAFMQAKNSADARDKKPLRSMFHRILLCS